MLTEDEQIAHADRGPPTITIAEFCKREGLDQRRLLGAMIHLPKLETPMFAHEWTPTHEQLKNPGSLLMLDNWQAEKYAREHRIPKPPVYIDELLVNPERAMKDTCQSCRFGFGTNGGFIDCHRHAPLPRTDGSPSDRYLNPDPVFPMLKSWDWCGDFEKRSDTAGDAKP